MLLIAGTVAVTSAHLSRMRLLDVADGAALSAANALDDSAYAQGVGESVPLSNGSVQERAAAYLGTRPRPGAASASGGSRPAPAPPTAAPPWWSSSARPSCR